MQWKEPSGRPPPLTRSKDLTSTYREILSEGQPSTTGTSATSWAPSLPAFVPQCLRLLRGLTLFSLSAAGSAAAAAGLGLLAYLLLSRTLTPAQHLHTRPLFLDYSASDLLAQAAFLPSEYDLGSGAVLPDLPASTRFLPVGQRVDVWLELDLPPSPANLRGGMAQVVAELVSLDGRTAARTSIPLLLRNGFSFWATSALATPLRWAGLVSSVHTLRVPVFQGYREQDKTPFAVFQVAIKVRDSSWVPEVQAARVSVRLRLGLLTRLLYALRPGPLLMLALGCGAVALVLGGSAAALIFFALWLYTVWGGGEAAGEEGVPEEEELAGGSSDLSLGPTDGDDTGSISGLSEVESVGRWRSGEVAAEPAAAGPGVAAEEEEWQEVEPESSTAGAAGARGWQPAAAARKKGPVPGGPALSEDTAWLGSSMGGSTAGLRGEWAGQIRRRASATAQHPGSG